MRIVFLILLSLVTILCDAQNNKPPPIVQRDPNVILNHFYLLKKSNPAAAKKTLDFLVAEFPNNIIALKEMGYWYLQQKEPKIAAQYFEKVMQLIPQDYNTALELAYIYEEMGEKSLALKYFNVAKQSPNLLIKQKALNSLSYYAAGIPVPLPQSTATKAPAQTMSLKQRILSKIFFFKTSPAPPPPSIPLHPVPPTIVYPKPSSKILTLPKVPPLKIQPVISKVPVTKLQPQPLAPKPITVSGLLNDYYALKDKNSKAAEKQLQHILILNPKNVEAITELGYYYLRKNDNQLAIKHFQNAYELTNDPKFAMQIGYIYNILKDNIKAIEYFKKALPSQDKKIRAQAELAIKNLTPPKIVLPLPTKYITLPPIKITYETYLNQFYALKKTNEKAAEIALLRAIELAPENVQVLNEAGYFYLKQEKLKCAACYFRRSFEIDCNPKIAMELGFIYDKLDKKGLAYGYFLFPAHAKDPELRKKGNTALDNLAGWATKGLPMPYFIDEYATPLYYSRFDDFILPMITRAGVYFGDDKQGQAYLSIRSTRDTQSSAGVSPEIFEDNVAIFAEGLSYQPFKKLPLIFFGELGRAYDIINQNRSRWRGDARGGAVFSDVYGRKNAFSDTLQFPLKWIADSYADSIYYTRYDNNWISDLRIRPGLRLLEFHTFQIDAYYKMLGIVDTNHEFFNNLVELGPGIRITPNFRYNLRFYYEVVRGYYIPVNSPDPNPYGSHYNTKYAVIEYYVRF